MKVSIIIVNYNTTDHLKACLNSINTFFNKDDFEVIVVDNFSSDRSIDRFPLLFSEFRFIFNNTNNGFGAGCNVGAKESTGDVLAFTNPDLVFEENVFIQLKELIIQETTGVCGTILKDFDDTLIYSYNKFPGFFWEFLQATGTGTNEYINKKLLCDNIIKSTEPFNVDWIVGAFMVLRKEVFENIGGFDENFFLYYEDTDLCKMIHDKGYKNVIVPGLKVKHFQRGSIKSVKSENIYYFNMMRSRIIFIHKHYNFIKRFIIKFLLLNGYLYRKLLLKFRKKFRDKMIIKNFQYAFTIKMLLSSLKNVLAMKYEYLEKSAEIQKFENEKILKFTD